MRRDPLPQDVAVSFINKDYAMKDIDELARCVVRGKDKDANKLAEQLLAQGTPAETILDEGLLKGMEEVGRLFGANEIFLAEVLIAARAMKAGMRVLEPALATSRLRFKGKVILGTVKGDLHDIGKNIVAIMMQGAGFEVIDLGADVPIERFVEAVKEHAPLALGMSALLTTTMVIMGDVVQAIDEAGLKPRTKIIVGGAPLTKAFASEIGADAFCASAPAGVDFVKTLL